MGLNRCSVAKREKCRPVMSELRLGYNRRGVTFPTAGKLYCLVHDCLVVVTLLKTERGHAIFSSRHF